MRFRKLRIAWSVGCAIAGLLLIVLWVRSYWWMEGFRYGATESRGVIIESISGEVDFSYCLTTRRLPSRCWSTYVPTSYSTLQKLLLSNFSAKSFHRRFYPDGVLTAVPYWFFVVSAGVVPGVPWIRWPKQFTLRTLLIATTLVAVVLGLIVRLSR
jgi:hypothetical protein